MFFLDGLLSKVEYLMEFSFIEICFVIFNPKAQGGILQMICIN